MTPARSLNPSVESQYRQKQWYQAHPVACSREAHFQLFCPEKIDGLSHERRARVPGSKHERSLCASRRHSPRIAEGKGSPSRSPLSRETWRLRKLPVELRTPINGPDMFTKAGRSWPDLPAVTGAMFNSGGIGLNGPEALRPPTAAVLQLKLPLVFLSGPSSDPRTSKGDI
ncbi:hypothetical protein RJ639_010554 [Escallonia herrerae]|uniref:Uncharacterized protein n=1 Tax=Escallonia herrerae TaxID=1293975 RepID=A0AA89APX4_9ASTE|nr:hypothetical protein RJ639_010554 [Escallonia herrerae]